MVFYLLWLVKLPMAKYLADINQKNVIQPKMVNQEVSMGKLKIVGPHYAHAKNFEFALRNPLVDHFRLDKIFLTYICPHIWP